MISERLGLLQKVPRLNTKESVISSSQQTAQILNSRGRVIFLLCKIGQAIARIMTSRIRAIEENK